MSKSKRKVEVSTEQMDVIQIEIINGIPKSKSSLVMTKALSKFWDEVEKEIKKMPKKSVLDLRPEIPG